MKMSKSMSKALVLCTLLVSACQAKNPFGFKPIEEDARNKLRDESKGGFGFKRIFTFFKWSWESNSGKALFGVFIIVLLAMSLPTAEGNMFGHCGNGEAQLGGASVWLRQMVFVPSVLLLIGAAVVGGIRYHRLCDDDLSLEQYNTKESGAVVENHEVDTNDSQVSRFAARAFDKMKRHKGRTLFYCWFAAIFIFGIIASSQLGNDDLAGKFNFRFSAIFPLIVGAAGIASMTTYYYTMMKAEQKFLSQKTEAENVNVPNDAEMDLTEVEGHPAHDHLNTTLPMSVHPPVAKGKALPTSPEHTRRRLAVLDDIVSGKM